MKDTSDFKLEGVGKARGDAHVHSQERKRSRTSLNAKKWGPET